MSKNRKMIRVLGIMPFLFYATGFYLDWVAALFMLSGTILVYILNEV